MKQQLSGYHTLALVCVGAVAMPSALAGTADAVPPEAGQIERVEVTATRTGAVDVQQVPAAITVLKPESLGKYGLGNLNDIADLVPAMTVQQQATGALTVTHCPLFTRPRCTQCHTATCAACAYSC